MPRLCTVHRCQWHGLIEGHQSAAVFDRETQEIGIGYLPVSLDIAVVEKVWVGNADVGGPMLVRIRIQKCRNMAQRCICLTQYTRATLVGRLREYADRAILSDRAARPAIGCRVSLQPMHHRAMKLVGDIYKGNQRVDIEQRAHPKCPVRHGFC